MLSLVSAVPYLDAFAGIRLSIGKRVLGAVPDVLRANPDMWLTVSRGLATLYGPDKSDPVELTYDDAVR